MLVSSILPRYDVQKSRKTTFYMLASICDSDICVRVRPCLG
ncbi:hypothetical protein F383_18059 [Gossypium arboreum]|uniref:Uncharacterized protein n=1 Tax=Gossypium arboreum TaxID=29729 RepID=A0A0B0NUD2_GOSAR|nr:hypothetical protein F383_18059 [Gossypium arboreum]